MDWFPLKTAHQSLQLLTATLTATGDVWYPRKWTWFWASRASEGVQVCPSEHLDEERTWQL